MLCKLCLLLCILCIVWHYDYGHIPEAIMPIMPTVPIMLINMDIIIHIIMLITHIMQMIVPILLIIKPIMLISILMPISMLNNLHIK